jgi:Ca2+-binding RTX toxin-like protein
MAVRHVSLAFLSVYDALVASGNRGLVGLHLSPSAPPKKGIDVKKSALLLASVMTALLLAGEVALAANIQCPTKPGTNACVGTASHDELRGTSRPDFMDALGGDDQLLGKLANDVLHGRTGKDALGGDYGADVLYGEGGHDTLVGGPGKDLLKGGPAEDLYEFNSFSWGADAIKDVPEPLTFPEPAANPYAGYYRLQAISFAGEIDPSLDQPLTIHLISSPSRPEVATASGTSTLNWPNNAIDHVQVGSHADDIVSGNPAANYIASHYGDDTVSGGGGDDLINVAVSSREPSGDTVDCGEGNDTVYYKLGDTVDQNCETQILNDSGPQ